MGVEFKDSVDKHGIPREDTLHAMMNTEVARELDGARPGEVRMLYIGHSHNQTERYIEVIAAHRPPRTIVIHHSMPLSDLFRHLLDEGKQRHDDT